MAFVKIARTHGLTQGTPLNIGYTDCQAATPVAC